MPIPKRESDTAEDIAANLDAEQRLRERAWLTLSSAHSQVIQARLTLREGGINRKEQLELKRLIGEVTAVINTLNAMF